MSRLIFSDRGHIRAVGRSCLNELVLLLIVIYSGINHVDGRLCRNPFFLM